MSNFVTQDTPPGEWVRDWKQTDTLLALREVFALGRRVTPAVARRAGLSQTEMAAMEELSQRPMGPAELSQLLGVTSAAASGIIDRLTDRGHVERRAHASDGRRRDVHVTDSGRAEAIRLLLPMFQELAAADADLSEEDRQVVLRYLQRVIGALNRVV